TQKGELPTRVADRIPRMGQILDHNEVPLVTSVTFYDIYMDPTVVDQDVFDAQISELCAGLHRLFPEKSAYDYEAQIRKARANGVRYLLIRRKVTNAARKKLRELPIFELGQMKGGIIDNIEVIMRKKPFGNLLNRTLGYYKIQNAHDTLRVGIEGAYYDYLKGEEGKEIEQRISSGWKRTGKIIKDAVEGADVVTTIDKEIQEVAHSELEKQMIYMDAEHGSVILMEVKTGYVRAIANLTKVSKGKYTESFNYAIGHLEVPGSTFKLASIMAGLEDERFKITDKVNATGRYTVGGDGMSDSNYGMGYGVITIQQAFEKSSNVILQLMNRSYRKDPEVFIERLKQFGLTEKLGIDLEGEPRPKVSQPGDANWSALSLPWTSVGYEVMQTPLQTLAFYNAVANNGQLVRPLFVEKIKRHGQVIKSFKPVVLNPEICSTHTLQILQKCLEGVMIRGTGKQLKSSLFSIAGKTGTAQLRGESGYREQKIKAYQASFVGYFPAKKPIYSCIVVISRPVVAYYGAAVSGTVFAEIANKIYASALQYHRAVNDPRNPLARDVPQFKSGNSKDVTYLLKQLNVRYQLNSSSEWVQADTADQHLQVQRKAILDKKVPNVSGMSAKDAVYLLESRGLIVRLVGRGQVYNQSIAPGQPLVKGQLIQIKLH
ncbi:MAG: transpeptidase family protein, partial [Crocinitomicaceae bacterium]|nr:transpeptidase family protein [Crocinitomicaceae bacterium]MDP4805507.1 transpeptidase family protein [Crocinitomicaceae bacterium]MDP4955008.1 transpeptidase family protein [Crocinitomicaceae bacterium]MDP5065841.1 transpeptidase family protein [Crocinitomicaceae bacterium]